MDDKFVDQCGVFGIYSRDEDINVSHTIYLGLYALQHRGQESCGIVTSNGNKFDERRKMGLVQQNFKEEDLAKLNGAHGIGHVRYSTTGGSTLSNAQPIIVQYKKGNIAVAHNGTIVNAKHLREELEQSGSIFQSTVDSEVIIHLIARSRKGNIKDVLLDVFKQVEGAYSILVMTNDEVIGIRDASAFRPLCLGVIGDSYCIASESCALEQVGAQYLRAVEPNEMIILNKEGYSSYQLENTQAVSMCVFELIYLSRPDSIVYDKTVYLMRKSFGKALGKEHPIEVDVVIPVPDSGIPSALGYCEETKIPYDMGLLRNHYVGRTFIQPKSTYRQSRVKIKLSPVLEIIQGKRVAIVDDSIVRGTTSKEIVKMLREAGAKEIHILVTSPPINYPCYYGIDTPNREELIAPTHKEDFAKISNSLGADSVYYISMEGMLSVLEDEGKKYCKACFDGYYPVEPKDYLI